MNLWVSSKQGLSFIACKYNDDDGKQNLCPKILGLLRVWILFIHSAFVKAISYIRLISIKSICFLHLSSLWPISGSYQSINYNPITSINWGTYLLSMLHAQTMLINLCLFYPQPERFPTYHKFIIFFLFQKNAFISHRISKSTPIYPSKHYCFYYIQFPNL